MANWYGIDGIDFHWRGAWADPEITLDGITDSICVDVEDAMWNDFEEDYPEKSELFFEQYMLENSETVKDRVREFRALIAGVI